IVFFNCYTQGKFVIFEISDDGPGISNEVMRHLFDRFAKGSDGKHGIGLALVKAIAEEHDGTVEAGNKPEGGAIFKVKIPMIKTKTQLSLFNKSRDN
ncbi:MAG: HAMP domain-containing histidine kinase, partial [Clostridiales bacterium]|nr:HAMP domain-containing histidine kinase [Clostridiales bacterium]